MDTALAVAGRSRTVLPGTAPAPAAAGVSLSGCRGAVPEAAVAVAGRPLWAASVGMRGSTDPVIFAWLVENGA